MVLIDFVLTSSFGFLCSFYCQGIDITDSVLVFLRGHTFSLSMRACAVFIFLTFREILKIELNFPASTACLRCVKLLQKLHMPTAKYRKFFLKIRCWRALKILMEAI